MVADVFFVYAVLICYFRSKIFEICHCLKGFIGYIRVVIYSAFCSRDMNVCLVFSAFMSVPTPALATKNFLWFSVGYEQFFRPAN
jgi:hypothetical protein